MGQTTSIEWCHATFNPWEGCAKISAGCRNCYAEGQHRHRLSALGSPGGPGTCWGIGAPRMARSESYWKQPLRWDKEAAGLGIRRRVFCASMADVFEQQSELSRGFAGQTAPVPTGPDRTPRQVRFVDLDAERVRLLELIRSTPHLDWLLLTKRPAAILQALRAVRQRLHAGQDLAGRPADAAALTEWVERWLAGNPPHNVWLGSSVEDQASADERVPALLEVPARVRFLSCEPLLEAVTLTDYLPLAGCSCGEGPDDCRCRLNYSVAADAAVDWVIVGGESGPRARLMHPDWARQLAAECRSTGTAFLFKQWGEWSTAPVGHPHEHPAGQVNKTAAGEPAPMWRVGKKLAGRQLDGRTHDGVPG